MNIKGSTCAAWTAAVHAFQVLVCMHTGEAHVVPPCASTWREAQGGPVGPPLLPHRHTVHGSRTAMESVMVRKLVICLAGRRGPVKHLRPQYVPPLPGIYDPWRLWRAQGDPTALVIMGRSEDRHWRAPRTWRSVDYQTRNTALNHHSSNNFGFCPHWDYQQFLVDPRGETL